MPSIPVHVCLGDQRRRRPVEVDDGGGDKVAVGHEEEGGVGGVEPLPDQGAEEGPLAGQAAGGGVHLKVGRLGGGGGSRPIQIVLFLLYKSNDIVIKGIVYEFQNVSPLFDPRAPLKPYKPLVCEGVPFSQIT